MTPHFYLILHLSGVFMVLTGYGAAVALALNGVAARGSAGRSLAVVTHGVGLLFVLVGGFGLLAKNHIDWGNWTTAKVVIWLALGGLLTLILRKPAAARPLWFGVLALAVTAAVLGILRPF
jgi:hypothetical protein